LCVILARVSAVKRPKIRDDSVPLTAPLPPLLLTTMSPSATFCNVPLSTSVDPSSDKSLLSLDWVLSSGIPAPQSVASGALALPYGDSICSMHVSLLVRSSLPYDLVLGRDWLFFCRQTLPHASFALSSGVVTPGMPSSMSFEFPFWQA
jgi:hypothetical protein